MNNEEVIKIDFALLELVAAIDKDKKPKHLGFFDYWTTKKIKDLGIEPVLLSRSKKSL